MTNINDEDEDIENEEDAWCIKCGKSGHFPDGMCESCWEERNLE